MSLRLAVCEAPPELRPGDADWGRLAVEVGRTRADVLLLNEMPFGPWLAAAARPDPVALADSCRLHDRGASRLSELGAAAVLGSRPVTDRTGTVNQAFVWTAGDGARSAGHTKQHFPDEEGYWEGRWFGRGEERFGVRRVSVPGASAELAVGFLICTDVWFNERARGYGRRGAHLIAVPRATPAGSTDRWRTAVRMAALVSGCYAASSNRVGVGSTGHAFGGRGWVFSPDGDLLAETSPDGPVAAAAIDPDLAVRARAEYPRYVEEPAGEAVEEPKEG